MIDEHLGLPLDEGKEILAAHLEAAIDPAVEVGVAAEGQVTLENDSIMAAENGYNGVSESLVKVRRHGVLLPGGVANPWNSRTPCHLKACGCGESRVRESFFELEPTGDTPFP